MRNPFFPKAQPWLLALLLAAPVAARAQSVGIGTTTPAATAALDIQATDKGLLIPRLTAAQRTGITNPPQGLMVYQTDGTAGGGPQTGFWYFGGGPAAWVFVNPAGGGADNLGNHTATQTLNLQANALTGTGASVGTAVGVGIRADGGLNLGQNTAGTNVFVGYQAGAATTTGVSNQFMGRQSGQFNSAGNANLFVGNASGQLNSAGSYNLFVGHSSGLRNTMGDNNQFSGFQSGFSNTTGDRNHFSGYASGLSNITGNENQFTGYQSGYSASAANQNQFNGYQSGYRNTSGHTNQFDGYQSGYNTTIGNQNQFSGFGSGYNTTTGSGNQFSGFGSGSSNTTGSNNWAFGYVAGPTTGNLTNAGAIGYQAKVSQSNSLVLGGLGANAVKVGIGTSSPTQPLDVVGNGVFSGDVTATNLRPTGTVNMGWTQVSGTYTLSTNTLDIYTLACPSGTRALGGGGGHRDATIDASDIIVNYSGPDPADPEHKWRVIMRNDASVGRVVRVYCNCARIAP